MLQSALIVEDLSENQRWLVEALQQSFTDIQIDIVSSVAAAHCWLDNQPAPSLALVDLGLPDGSGLSVIERMNHDMPDTIPIVATIHDDDAYLFPALRAGARGYLLKDQGLVEAVSLLQGMVAGQPPLSPSIARRILASFQRPIIKNDSSLREEDRQLTSRESEVLRMIGKGLTLAETARLLALSRHTVDSHVKSIYRKLNISSRAEAAISARKIGLI